MFRRKKNLGTVTVFEDEPEGFDDLGLEEAESRHADPEALDQMTTQQLEALALSSASAGKESTARALRMATEAREIGVNTAETMQKQTAQLEKMSEDIEVVHDHLDKSERIIDKMTKPKLVRMFQKKKSVGKGLDKVRTSRKDQEAREQMKQHGLESLDIENMNEGPGEVSLDELNRDELFDGAAAEATPAKRGWRGRRNKEPVAPKETRAITEDYSQYSSGVAKVLREQDDDLDQISDALKDMRDLAGAMNNELQYQEKLINEVQDFTVETSARTKQNARKINKIK